MACSDHSVQDAKHVLRLFSVTIPVVIPLLCFVLNIKWLAPPRGVYFLHIVSADVQSINTLLFGTVSF